MYAGLGIDYTGKYNLWIDINKAKPDKPHTLPLTGRLFVHRRHGTIFNELNFWVMYV